MGSGKKNIKDYDWDWDLINSHDGGTYWRCRGIQTGRWADSEKCLFDLKTDDQWPGLGKE